MHPCSTVKQNNDPSLLMGTRVHSSVMVSAIDKLCNALTPKQVGNEKRAITSTLSSMKNAELRGTYRKQLSERRQLHENGVLTEDEYVEQREELVQLMRQLKDKKDKDNVISIQLP